MKIHMALILLTVASMHRPGAAASDDPAPSEMVFCVQWCDVGKSALKGLNGVVNATKGFRGFRENNTVLYDPARIQPERMPAALKAAGTCLGTAEQRKKLCPGVVLQSCRGALKNPFDSYCCGICFAVRFKFQRFQSPLKHSLV